MTNGAKWAVITEWEGVPGRLRYRIMLDLEERYARRLFAEARDRHKQQEDGVRVTLWRLEADSRNEPLRP